MIRLKLSVLFSYDGSRNCSILYCGKKTKMGNNYCSGTLHTDKTAIAEMLNYSVGQFRIVCSTTTQDLPT